MHEYFIAKKNGDHMWVYADSYEHRGALTVFVVDGVDMVQVASETIETITMNY